MGVIYFGRCECGYVTDEIYAGSSGFLGNEFNTFPYYCEDCNSLVMLDASVHEAICSECSSHNVVRYNADKFCTLVTNVIHTVDLRSDVSTELKLSKDNNLCPKCKKNTLSFEMCGFWD